MGTVYAATDTLLHRAVALKVLDPGEDQDEAAYRARLLREARIAARVEHERIARVYDVGEHEGSLFVAMELVRGVTLRRRMSERPLTPAEIVGVARQIAEGLAALHAAGVFHRDLKPENVMLTEKGGVRLLDFGLARRDRTEAGGLAAPGAGPFEGESVPSFSGTPAYMAPEQWMGAELDSRVDVFALGVIVYELVAANRPFELPGGLRAPLGWSAPDLSGEAWARMPADLVTFTARMLARDRAARFPDGEAVLAALAAPAAVAIEPAEPRAALDPGGRSGPFADGGGGRHPGAEAGPDRPAGRARPRRRRAGGHRRGGHRPPRHVPPHARAGHGVDRRRHHHRRPLGGGDRARVRRDRARLPAPVHAGRGAACAGDRPGVPDRRLRGHQRGDGGDPPRSLQRAPRGGGRGRSRHPPRGLDQGPGTRRRDPHRPARRARGSPTAETRCSRRGRGASDGRRCW